MLEQEAVLEEDRGPKKRVGNCYGTSIEGCVAPRKTRALSFPQQAEQLQSHWWRRKRAEGCCLLRPWQKIQREGRTRRKVR